MAIPEDRIYTRDHLWCQINENVVTIGLTERGVKRLGAIRFVELPDPEDDVLTSVGVAEVESDKEVVDIFSPFDGVIVESHTTLEDHPEYLETDPYGKGWLVKIRMDNPAAGVGILSPGEYKEMVAEKR